MRIVFTVADVADILKDRQGNNFDARMAVVGNTGDGKSTLISKILYKTGKYKPKKQLVYSREDIMQLIENQTCGICHDDEAINSGYKRDFQNRGQHDMIKMLTTHRSSRNIFASAIPNFFSLDKDLRELFFVMIHVIERGVAVVHMPLEGSLFNQDRWDAKNNAKIEQSWVKRRKKNPDFRPPYHELTTFRGYIYWNDLTPKQRDLYEKIRAEKRIKRGNSEGQEIKKLTFPERLVVNLLGGREINKDILIEMCMVEGEKYNNLVSKVNIILKNKGIKKTLSELLTRPGVSVLHSKNTAVINNIIPTFSA